MSSCTFAVFNCKLFRDVNYKCFYLRNYGLCGEWEVVKKLKSCLGQVFHFKLDSFASQQSKFIFLVTSTVKKPAPRVCPRLNVKKPFAVIIY